MQILDAFKKYEELMDKLYDLTFKYHNAFGKLEQQIVKESILEEKVSDEEKEEIETKITELETKISEVQKDLINHVKMMETLLKRDDNALQEKAVDRINRIHISTMVEYNGCITFLKDLKNNYGDWNFSKVEIGNTIGKECRKLNEVIGLYNEKNLNDVDYKVLNVIEAKKIAEEEASKV